VAIESAGGKARLIAADIGDFASIGRLPGFRFLKLFAGYGHGWFRTSDLSRVKRRTTF
jgi:hypothetical protein